MARPTKRRKVCRLPNSNRFGPLETPIYDRDYISMTVDEYETIRLIDLEKFTQEECSEQMKIARTTVQGIYIEARRKIADALVNSKVLIIEGGEYQLCDDEVNSCGLGCYRHGRGVRRGLASKALFY